MFNGLYSQHVSPSDAEMAAQTLTEEVHLPFFILAENLELKLTFRIIDDIPLPGLQRERCGDTRPLDPQTLQRL